MQLDQQNKTYCVCLRYMFIHCKQQLTNKEPIKMVSLNALCVMLDKSVCKVQSKYVQVIMFSKVFMNCVIC